MKAMDYSRLLNFLVERKETKREASSAGYKGWATRIDKATGKDIRPSTIKKYLKKKDDSKSFKDIDKRAKGKSNPKAYKWGTKYLITKRHFEKR